MTEKTEQPEKEIDEESKEENGNNKKSWPKFVLVSVVIFVIIGYLVLTQITIFVVQPIGAVPEGKTVIISRMNTMNFIDSADAWCERQRGKVSLLCRGAILAKLGNNATIYLRLPYSKTLYLWSTGGKEYAR